MKKELVDLVMKKWDIPNLCIKEIYGNDSEDFPRIICKVGTDTSAYVLKGITGIPESTIISNVQEYLCLGNEHSLAPKLYLTKEGTYYVREQEYFFFLMEFIDGRKMECRLDWYRKALAVCDIILKKVYCRLQHCQVQMA